MIDGTSTDWISNKDLKTISMPIPTKILSNVVTIDCSTRWFGFLLDYITNQQKLKDNLSYQYPPSNKKQKIMETSQQCQNINANTENIIFKTLPMLQSLSLKSNKASFDRN